MSNQDKIVLQVLRSIDVLSGSTSPMARQFDGESYPKLPEPDSIEFGEIALNIAKGYEVIAIKNYDGEVVYLPFNVAVRLLDAETRLDDLSGYTLSSISEISGATVSMYDDIEYFKREIQERIEIEIGSFEGEVNSKIGELSAYTTTSIDEFGEVVDSLASSAETLSNDVSGIRSDIDTLEGDFNDKIAVLSGDTDYKIGQVDGRIDDVIVEVTDEIGRVKSDIEDEIGNISAETQSSIDALDDKIDNAYSSSTAYTESVRGEIEVEISSLSGETHQAVNEINQKIDDAVSGITQGIDNVKEAIESEIESLSSETSNSIDELSSRIDQISSGSTADIERVKEELEAEIQDLGHDVSVSISEVSDRVSELSSTTQSQIESVYDKIDDAVSDCIMVLSGDILTVSATTYDHIDDVENEINNRIAILSGETDYKINQVEISVKGDVENLSASTDSKLDDIWDTIEEVSAATGEISSATTEYVDEKFSKAESEINAVSGAVSDLTVVTVDGFNRVDENLVNLDGKISMLSGDVSSLRVYTENEIAELSSSTKTFVEASVEDAIRVSKEYTDESISDLNAATVEYVDTSITELKSDIDTEIEEKSSEARESAVSEANAYTDSVGSSLNSKIDAVSASTESSIEGVYDAITNIKLGDLADVDITENEIGDSQIEVLAKSGTTWNNQIIGVSSKEKYGFVKIGEGLEVENGVVSGQRLDIDTDILSGSTNPVAGGAVYDAVQSLSGDVESLYVKTDSLDSSLSELSEDFNELSAETKADIESISGSVSSYTSTLEEIELVHAGAFAAFKRATGVDVNVGYNPRLEELDGYDMTEAIDYIGEYAQNLNRETERLESGIEGNEMVHAAAFARMNHSLGFTDNAEFEPASQALETMTVTEAIDYLCQGYENIELYLVTEDTSQFIRSVTYENLCKLYVESKLRRGILYRITNYQATVNAEHHITRVPVVASDRYTNMGFDIIVRATSDNTLDENARAIISKGNNYFEDCAVNAWEIKYSLLNDTGRFSWAKEDGFGVIYYMKDEYGNEAPYDFKNILNVYSGVSKFTFNDASVLGDMSMTGRASGNIIKPAYDFDYLNRSLQVLNNVTINGAKAIGNTFGGNCKDILMNGDFVDNYISSTVNGRSITGTYSGSMIGYTNVSI